jgi:peroxiredoxin family protein
MTTTITPHPSSALEADAQPPTKRARLAIIASKGTLDWAYPPLMLALQAARKGWEVAIFFTFYGLNIIHRRKGKHLQVAPLGNPAMPMPVPNLLGAIPGMTALATLLMRWQFRHRKVPSVDELLQRVIDAGVKLYPCGFSIDVYGYKPEDFVPGCEKRLGSPEFLEFAKDAQVTLFV